MNKPILVIMAAGMGSRYGGLKQIDPVGPGGQIILDYSLIDARRAGFERVVFIVRPELEQAFEQAIGQKARKTMQVDYAYQTLQNLPEGLCAPEGREKPLGTAHAVWCAAELAAGAPIAVINADDFYGADAFQKIYDYLAAAQDDAQSYRYCMVGYRVENTLTENGTVSRGVCTTNEQGQLTNIVERTAIARGADGIIRYAVDGGETGEIAKGTLVSMNLWGFTPSFTQELTGGLRNFFATQLPKNPMKGEYYLPYAVDELIHAGKAVAQVLQTDARWFGVTYREDKPVVCAAIRDMTEQGVYSATL